MAGELILDTNIVIPLLEHDPIIENHARGKIFYFPSSVVGELYYGAAKGKRSAENIKRLEQFLSSASVLPCDLQTAKFWGEIKARLDSKGMRIPDNDIWIAASALQHKLILVTRDKHFDAVEGLIIQSWS